MVPTNFAIVVGADIDYVEVRPTQGKYAGKKFYFGKPLLSKYEKELGEDYEVVRELKGSEMAGWRYWPVFPYFAGDKAESEGNVPGRLPNLYRGLRRHRRGYRPGSPGPYGEDDMNTLNAHGIKSTDVLDAGCRFTAQCPDYEGMYVFDANKPILRNLRNGDDLLAEIPRASRDPVPGEELCALLPALLALRHAADLQACELLVRVGDEDQAAPVGAQPADQLDS